MEIYLFSIMQQVKFLIFLPVVMGDLLLAFDLEMFSGICLMLVVLHITVYYSQDDHML